ncbi:MAG: TerB family tellurite resistance protein [Bacteroidia bacterium]|nr:TerB family tellurite resistance protein [Bacteroidia bacterium]MCX7652515.1 TerB family tellurite resistance protein [Bacteroidia bacterium]MDW8417635.1 TerB family tellurite resistance protein [Bacteroidia bacterium]
MLVSRRFWDGIGGLAYAFAKADGAIEESEMKAFANRIEEGFAGIPTNFPQRAEATFQLFYNLSYTPEKAYEEAIQSFAAVPDEVRHYRFDILNIFRQVIESDGKVHPYEEEFLRRLDADMERIVT